MCEIFSYFILFPDVWKISTCFYKVDENFHFVTAAFDQLDSGP